MIKKIIKQLVVLKNTYGEELLEDKRRLMAFIKDYFPFAKREHQLIYKGLETGVYKTLQKDETSEDMLLRNQCISMLHQEHLMDRRAAEDTVDLWIDFWRKDKARSTKSKENSFLDTGLGIVEREQLAAYEKTAEHGDIEAILKVAHGYYNGEGAPQDYEEARKWYEKAAQLNHVEAMNYLGNMYYMGQGVIKSYEEARKWYEKSALLESATAMNYMGNMYCEGKGVSVDKKEAMKWYERAARLGHYTAMFNMGYIHYEERAALHEENGVQDEKAGPEDGIEALYQLAYRYHTGDGAQQNYEKAFQLYHELALQGESIAMIWTAYMYLNGQGVAKDKTKAIAWCKKASQSLL